MEIYHIHPFGIRFDDDSPFWRKPVRPESLQDNLFRKQFDYTTLVYDIFTSHDGAHAIWISPPFFNLEEYILQTKLYAVKRGNRAEEGQCRAQLSRFDRMSQIIVELPDREELLRIESPMGNWLVPIASNMCHLFQGKNALITKQKNNKIEWITDWINLNSALHGINAVLLIDNESTEYTTATLLEELARNVSGIETLVVYSWPYPFGPTGGFNRPKLSKGMGIPWDSDFTNFGILQTGLWRFLATANSILWGDIDELCLSLDGRPLMEKINDSPIGVVRFAGDRPVRIYGEGYYNPLENLSCSDFFKYPISQLGNPSEPKWAADPKKISTDSQLCVHSIILHGQYLEMIDTTVKIAHFHPLSNNWKYQRSSVECFFDPRLHYFDCLLVKTLAGVAKQMPNYDYPLKEVLAFAKGIGACPRPAVTPYVVAHQEYDCAVCPFREF